MSIIIEQLSKFHFVVLHFPVVMLTLIPMATLAALMPFGKIWRPVLPYFVHLGTLTAIPTVLFGKLLMLNRSSVTEALQWHEILGYATLILMILFSGLLLLKKPQLENEIPKWFIALALIAGGIVTATAHLGGESVHGSLIILFQGDGF